MMNLDSTKSVGESEYQGLQMNNNAKASTLIGLIFTSTKDSTRKVCSVGLNNISKLDKKIIRKGEK